MTVRRSLPAAVLSADRLPRRAAVTLAWDPRVRRVELRAGRAVWPIDLQLFFDGLTGPAGIGDVFICPVPGDGDRDQMHDIVLDNGQDRVAIQVHTDDLERFADAVDEVGLRAKRAAS